MTPCIRSSGNYMPLERKQPMSEARRQYVHGPLQALAEEARAAGLTPIWKAVVWGMAALVIFTLWAAMLP